MPCLENKTKNTKLINNLKIAKTFWSRGKGLLGRKELPADEALWIHRCNSIHTCFMKFSIDCVFLDKEMKVKAIHENVKPGFLIPPVWGANSVVEMASGSSRKLEINVGDELYVGD